jgi:CheY-like chemotaxis protein
MPRVLVLEDDALIAIDLASTLQSAGCAVLGPVQTQTAALDLIENEALDFALVDINLGRESAFGVADRLAARNIPFVFLTGHSRNMLPPDHADRPVISKPYDPARLIEYLLAQLKQKTTART